MSMKPCRECGTVISSRAKECPSCGVDKPFDLAIQRGLNSFANWSMKTGLFLTLLPIIIVVLFGCEQARAQSISEEEYRAKTIVLFKDFLQMKEDGVFSDQETIELLGQDHYSSTIRGDNPPGGWFARPPGSDWLKRVEDLYNTGHKFVCFDIPPMPSESGAAFGLGVCGHDLRSLQFMVADPNPRFLDAVAAKFWLATICHESPQACSSYVGPKE